jgi:tetratricopeptide (TPR) repeat protein
MSYIMTNLSSFIIKLKALLPESSWSWVISALTQDHQVWESLQDADFGDLALDRIGSNPESWTCANLALLRLDSSSKPDPLSLDASLRKIALRSYESFLEGQPEDQLEQHNLEQALLLAVALLEHRRLSGSWQTLPSDLDPIPQSCWPTTLACLYGLSSDTPALLSTLLFNDSPTSLRQAGLHALLSNPQSPKKQSQILQDVLTLQPMPEWVPILQELERSRPQLVTELAKHLLTKQPTFANRKRYQQNCEQVKHLTYLLALSELQRMAGQMEQGQTLHHLAVDAVEDLHTQMTNQTVDISIRTGDLNEAIIQWKEMINTRPTAKSIDGNIAPPNNLLFSLLENNRTADALDLIQTTGNSKPPTGQPAYYLAKAHQAAAEGDLKTARKAAKQALTEVTDTKADKLNGGNGKSNTDRNLSDLDEYQRMLGSIAQTLIDLDLPEQALEAAQLIIEQQPNNADALIVLARAQAATRDSENAVNNAHLAAALRADSYNHRYQLALCLEAANRWEEALLERKSLLDERFCQKDNEEWPTISTQKNLVNCATKAGDLDLAMDICQQILDKRPNDGTTHTLLGEIYVLQKDMQKALDHYQQGTELAPHLAFPWLSLANAQKERGLPGNVVDTLRQAAQAVPGDPTVHLALAEIYLEENALTQALTSLQHAQGLVTQPLLVSKANPWDSRKHNRQTSISVGEPLPCRVSMHLGETLRLLGHLEDALQVLENAYQDYPKSIELAKIYAKTLLSLGDYSHAIEPLKKVVNSNPSELEPYLDYAGALLTLQSDPDEAVQVLRKAEQIFPNDPYIIALLAEALADSGDLEGSQQNFYHALESNLANEAEWHSRLSLGLGKVSLKLAQPETAIASLQESIRTKPDNPQVHSVLAEAYASLDLRDEALEAARTALNQSPDDLEMLTWFSSLATQMESLNEAISALTRYVEIRPQDADMVVRLGQVQSHAGKGSDALDTLKRVITIEEASVDDLRQAARGLLDLDDPDSAATFLERALDKKSEPDSHLLLELANAYQQAGRSHQVLETLDKAISQDPKNPSIFLAKADHLASLGRAEDARTCLEDALNLHPEDPQLRRHLTLQLRGAGDIPAALSHAVKLVAIHRKNPSLTDAYSARALAADLARAMLQPAYARSFLLNTTEKYAPENAQVEQNEVAIGMDTSDQQDLSQHLIKSTSRTEPLAIFSYNCLSAELALDEGEEVAAAEALNQAIEQNPTHPRLLALQARLANRSGDSTAALEILQKTLEFIGKDTQWSQFLEPLLPNSENVYDADKNQQTYANAITTQALHQKHDFICTLVGIAAAAIELGQWDTALYMLRKAEKETPGEPYTQLQMARALVLRAEYQRLCQALKVIEHAPGPSALAKDTFRSFQNAIQTLTKIQSIEDPSLQENSDQVVSYWQKRGQAAFQLHEQVHQPGSISSDKFEPILERQSKDFAPPTEHEELEYVDSSNDPLQHSLSLAHLALASGKERAKKIDHERDIRAAQSAVRQQPKQPVFHALVAHLAKQSGDYTTALNSMLTALSIWPEEPRWHAIIAELHLSVGDTQTAIDHFHKAVELEPANMQHHLALGEAYQSNGDHQQAIESLKQAQRLAPDQLEPNLALARAFIMIQDPVNAATYVDHAKTLTPDHPEPLHLSAEIALQSGDPKAALSQARTALQLDPDRPETLCILARALSKMHQYDEALSVLETAVPLTTKPLPILLERAKLLEVSQGSAKALQALQELVEDYPDDPAVLANLAKNLAAEGLSQEAIQAAQSALHGRDGSWEPGEQASLHLLLGSLLRQSGQLDQAIHQLSESIRLSPQDMEPYLELATAQQDRRQHILALQTYQKAIEVAPNNPQPYYKASLALKDGRDYEGAERMLRQAANLAPDDVTIHRQLAALVALNLVHNRRSVPIEA